MPGPRGTAAASRGPPSHGEPQRAAGGPSARPVAGESDGEGSDSHRQQQLLQLQLQRARQACGTADSRRARAELLLAAAQDEACEQRRAADEAGEQLQVLRAKCELQDADARIRRLQAEERLRTLGEQLRIAQHAETRSQRLLAGAEQRLAEAQSEARALRCREREAAAREQQLRQDTDRRLAAAQGEACRRAEAYAEHVEGLERQLRCERAEAEQRLAAAQGEACRRAEAYAEHVEGLEKQLRDARGQTEAAKQRAAAAQRETVRRAEAYVQLVDYLRAEHIAAESRVAQQRAEGEGMLRSAVDVLRGVHRLGVGRAEGLLPPVVDLLQRINRLRTGRQQSAASNSPAEDEGDEDDAKGAKGDGEWLLAVAACQAASLAAWDVPRESLSWLGLLALLPVAYSRRGEFPPLVAVIAVFLAALACVSCKKLVCSWLGLGMPHEVWVLGSQFAEAVANSALHEVEDCILLRKGLGHSLHAAALALLAGLLSPLAYVYLIVLYMLTVPAMCRQTALAVTPYNWSSTPCTVLLQNTTHPPPNTLVIVMSVCMALSKAGVFGSYNASMILFDDLGLRSMSPVGAALFNRIPVVAVIGGDSSSVSMALLDGNATHPGLTASGIPLISSQSTSPALSDKAKYPRFIRVCTSSALSSLAMIQMFSKYGITRVAGIGNDDSYGHGALEKLVTYADRAEPKIEIAGLVYYPAAFSSAPEFFSPYLEQLKNLSAAGAEAFVLYCTGLTCLPVLEQARVMGLLHKPYAWVLGNGITTYPTIYSIWKMIPQLSEVIANDSIVMGMATAVVKTPVTAELNAEMEEYMKQPLAVPAYTTFEGYPYGRKEVWVKNLGNCLAGYKGWTRSFDYHLALLSSITIVMSACLALTEASEERAFGSYNASVILFDDLGLNSMSPVAAALFSRIPVVAVIGGDSSRVSMAVLDGNATHPGLSASGIPLISSQATSPLLSDRTKYPRFVRVCTSTALSSLAMIQMFSKYGITRVAGIGNDDSYGHGALEKLVTYADRAEPKIEIAGLVYYPAAFSSAPEFFSPYLEQLKNLSAAGAQAFVLYCTGLTCLPVLEQARVMGLLHKPYAPYNTSLLYSTLLGLEYTGATGDISFDENGDRFATISIFRFVSGSASLAVVGNWTVGSGVVIDPRHAPWALAAAQGEGRNVVPQVVGGVVGAVGFLTVAGAVTVAFLRYQRRLQRALLLKNTYLVGQSELTMGRELGQGSYGTVYQAQWRGTEVAAKVVPLSKHLDIDEEKLLQEVFIMRSLRHPNLLLFMCYAKTSEALTIVTEFMPRGSLLDVLSDRAVPVSTALKLSILSDVAAGMAYLHGSSPPVIHCDLKSSNILLSASMQAKVGDFGLTVIAHKHGSSAAQSGDSALGSLLWSAPETISSGELSTKSDVYAFSIMLWETVTRELPYRDMNPVLVSSFVAEKSLRPEVGPAFESVQPLRQLMERCWDASPDARPAFAEVLPSLSRAGELLHDLIQSERESSAERPAPLGRMAIVFTDIQQSTELWEWNAQLMKEALYQHHDAMRTALRRNKGYEVKTQGDAFMIAFQDAVDALRFCADAQRALVNLAWNPRLLEFPTCRCIMNGGQVQFRGLRVRMGIHYGEPDVERPQTNEVSTAMTSGVHSLLGPSLGSASAIDYIGPCVNKATRVASAAKGGQIVLSSAAAQEVLQDREGLAQLGKLHRMGAVHLQGIAQSEEIFGFAVAGIERTFDDVHASTICELPQPAPEDAGDLYQRFSKTTVPSWAIAAKEVETTKEVAEKGNFGVVFKGVWKSQAVAVKRFFRQKVDSVTVQEIEHQITKISQIRHPNIVLFLGACTEPHSMFVVTEWMDNGSLQQLIASSRQIDSQRGVAILTSTCSALMFLHQCGVVHRDLKSSNILLSKSMDVKVSDFGMGAVKTANKISTLCGSIAWMAPEVLSSAAYTEASDVYSFGVVMNEILTGEVPFKDLNKVAVSRDVLQGKRPDIPKQLGAYTSQYVDLMCRCWDQQPAQRPKFKEIGSCCTGNLTALAQPSASNGYNRWEAVTYADTYWNSPNHDCGSSYTSCTPYSYWGSEHCGYASHGGDGANFVSQCLLAGGHAPLSGGGPCRGYPCGSEEVGAKNLGDCLAGYKGWSRSCGYHLAPPSSITVGDVVVFHRDGCDSYSAQAAIVSAMSGGPRISTHSTERHDEAYTVMAGSMPYYRWGAVSYADTYWNTVNHDCGSYTSCTPYSYWGSEHCGYASHGGDGANFVSQCLLAGGHAPLSGGGPCRGYPCGSEEIGGKNLGDCLAGYKGWSRSCGYHLAPPDSITYGDVVVFHRGGCDSYTTQVGIVSSMSGGPRISTHSTERHDVPYTIMASSMPYYEWLHKY
eukprot:m51a1_g6125 putative serine threonine protein kinase (2351) ;mRNA; f:176074-200461